MTWTTLCHAKINTFLAVGPPDARGYHPLRTVFQTISLMDYLEVWKLEDASADSFYIRGMDLPPENTLTKTLRLVRELLPVPPLHITLHKSIPAQAGLGGGSSNAAGLLRILMKMMPDHFEERFAFEVAEAVGADVPFFLVGGRAKAEGYGQILTPLERSEPRNVVVAMPEDRCSTVEAYHRLDAVPREWRDFPEEIEDFGYNDFERVAPCGSLELIELLESQGYPAMLSGSGSAVVALCDNPQPVVESLKEKGYWADFATYANREHSLQVTNR